MITAAAVSSFLVFRIRPCGFSSVSVSSPRTSGITATPVSKPDSPSASLGNRMTAITAITAGLPCSTSSIARQRARSSGWRKISRAATARTTVLSDRYAATMTTASPIAS